MVKYLVVNREHKLSCLSPTLQIAVSLTNILQGVRRINQQFELTSLVHREYGVGNGSKFLPCSHVIKRDRTRHVQRSHCCESSEVKWRYRTARGPVKSEETTRPKAFQRLFKGSLADSVVDDIESGTFCDPLHFFVKFC